MMTNKEALNLYQRYVEGWKAVSDEQRRAVIEEVLGDGSPRERHDGIGEILAVVRSHPRFDGAAARESQGSADNKQTADGHYLNSYSLSIDRICVR